MASYIDESAAFCATDALTFVCNVIHQSSSLSLKDADSEQASQLASLIEIGEATIDDYDAYSQSGTNLSTILFSIVQLFCQYPDQKTLFQDIYLSEVVSKSQDQPIVPTPLRRLVAAFFLTIELIFQSRNSSANKGSDEATNRELNEEEVFILELIALCLFHERNYRGKFNEILFFIREYRYIFPDYKNFSRKIGKHVDSQAVYMEERFSIIKASLNKANVVDASFDSNSLENDSKLSNSFDEESSAAYLEDVNNNSNTNATGDNIPWGFNAEEEDDSDGQNEEIVGDMETSDSRNSSLGLRNRGFGAASRVSTAARPVTRMRASTSGGSAVKILNDRSDSSNSSISLSPMNTLKSFAGNKSSSRIFNEDSAIDDDVEEILVEEISRTTSSTKVWESAPTTIIQDKVGKNDHFNLINNSIDDIKTLNSSEADNSGNFDSDSESDHWQVNGRTYGDSENELHLVNNKTVLNTSHSAMAASNPGKPKLNVTFEVGNTQERSEATAPDRLTKASIASLFTSTISSSDGSGATRVTTEDLRYVYNCNSTHTMSGLGASKRELVQDIRLKLGSPQLAFDVEQFDTNHNEIKWADLLDIYKRYLAQASTQQLYPDVSNEDSSRFGNSKYQITVPSVKTTTRISAASLLNYNNNNNNNNSNSNNNINNNNNISNDKRTPIKLASSMDQERWFTEAKPSSFSVMTDKDAKPSSSSAQSNGITEPVITGSPLKPTMGEIVSAKKLDISTSNDNAGSNNDNQDNDRNINSNVRNSISSTNDNIKSNNNESEIIAVDSINIPEIGSTTQSEARNQSPEDQDRSSAIISSENMVLEYNETKDALDSSKIKGNDITDVNPKPLDVAPDKLLPNPNLLAQINSILNAENTSTEIKNNSQTPSDSVTKNQIIAATSTETNISAKLGRKATDDAPPLEKVPIHIPIPVPPLSELSSELLVIHEGYVTSIRSNKQRYMVLDLNHLRIYRSALDSLMGIIPLDMKEVIPISSITGVSVDFSSKKGGGDGCDFTILYSAVDSITGPVSGPDDSDLESVRSSQSSAQIQVEPMVSLASRPSFWSKTASWIKGIETPNRLNPNGIYAELHLRASDNQARLVWITLIQRVMVESNKKLV